jgi:flagellar basal-body rod modification protein FlgD
MSSIAITPSPTSSAATSKSSSASSSASTNPLANEQEFLQLLVAQMQNQDPMNPTDGEQYLSQLASFSQLEQQIGIHSDTSAIVTDLTPASSTSATPPTTGG